MKININGNPPTSAEISASHRKLVDVLKAYQIVTFILFGFVISWCLWGWFPPKIWLGMIPVLICTAWLSFSSSFLDRFGPISGEQRMELFTWMNEIPSVEKYISKVAEQKRDLIAGEFDILKCAIKVHRMKLDVQRFLGS